jgi:hypothetical protein
MIGTLAGVRAVATTCDAQVVESLMLAHDLEEYAWEPNRTLNLPGLVTTPKELIDAMARAGGDASLVGPCPFRATCAP